MQTYENIKQYTILYVEDEKQSVELVCSILKNRVKEIFVAYDGLEGLEKYKAHRPDIVISDIQMPNMNGIELSKKIKAINPAQNIILVTAFNENSFLMEAINLGIAKYIVKPIISIENLLHPISDICKVLSFDKSCKEQTRFQAMEEVLKTIAHHWRQPLNIISLESSSVKIEMEMGTFQEKEVMARMEHIYKITQNLSFMIDDFINMFSLTQTNTKEPFVIHKAIENVLKQLQQTLDKNSIKVIKHLDPHTIVESQNLLEQVLLYILQNSIESILQNNSKSQHKYIVLTTKMVDNTLELIIQDSAGGIEQSILPKVFEPYFSQKKVHSGTGMGLFITKKIIENQFDADISITNSAFTIEKKDCYGAKATLIFHI